jgi:hypothetical protein
LSPTVSKVNTSPDRLLDGITLVRTQIARPLDGPGIIVEPAKHVAAWAVTLRINARSPVCTVSPCDDQDRVDKSTTVVAG